MAPYQTGEGISINIYLNEIRDGDSFLARDEDASLDIEIRLYGVDAPEIGQRYGDEARECLKELVSEAPRCNLRVMGVTSGELAKRDRVIGLVYRESPFNSLSHEMARRGWAYWYYQSDEDNRFNISELENAAKQDRLGVWEDDGSELRPWDYRRIVALATENMDDVAARAAQAIKSRAAELATHMTLTIESIATQSAHIAEEQVRQQKEEAVEARIFADRRADEAERRATEAERRIAQEQEDAERIVEEERAVRDRAIETRDQAERDARVVRGHREILAWVASFLLLSFVSFLWFNSAWMLGLIINTAAVQLLYICVIPGVVVGGVYLIWKFLLKNLLRSPNRTFTHQGEGLEDESDSDNRATLNQARIDKALTDLVTDTRDVVHALVIGANAQGGRFRVEDIGERSRGRLKDIDDIARTTDPTDLLVVLLHCLSAQSAVQLDAPGINFQLVDKIRRIRNQAAHGDMNFTDDAIVSDALGTIDALRRGLLATGARPQSEPSPD